MKAPLESQITPPQADLFPPSVTAPSHLRAISPSLGKSHLMSVTLGMHQPPDSNSAVGKIPIPCISNTTKGHANQLPNYGHHLGNPALASADSNSNSKQSPSYVYPPPGNQWLVPVMSPFEGLVYKPIIWPCPPNAGFMAPING
ncbi:hypothetical protein JHK87_048094 [Glycine soja]|nr:hypothetical protein JHK87_048094 [Glycine soja]